MTQHNCTTITPTTGLDHSIFTAGLEGHALDVTPYACLHRHGGCHNKWTVLLHDAELLHVVDLHHHNKYLQPGCRSRVSTIEAHHSSQRLQNVTVSARPHISAHQQVLGKESPVSLLSMSTSTLTLTSSDATAALDPSPSSPTCRHDQQSHSHC